MPIDPILRAVIDASILLFVAKFIGLIFNRFRISEVFGFLLAGIILGPYAFGGLTIGGFQLIELNTNIRTFARIGALILLFLVGLQISFTDFRKIRFRSLELASSSVIISLAAGVLLYAALGEAWIASIVVAASLTVSSVVAVIEHLHKPGTTNLEGRIGANAAAISNILGILILSIIVALIEQRANPDLSTLSWLISKTVLLSAALLLVTVFAVSKLIRRVGGWGVYLGRSGGTMEVLITVYCFSCAALAYTIGLSSTIGALIAGVAVAGSHIMPRVKDYASKMGFLFTPLFYVIVGAQLNIGTLDVTTAIGAIALIAIALFSKLLGCGLPAYLMLRNRVKSVRIALGMLPQGSVGLIIAGVGLSSAAISSSIYVQIIVMNAVIALFSSKLLRLTDKK